MSAKRYTSKDGVSYLTLDPNIQCNAAIVLLHGAGCEATDFEPIFPLLVERAKPFTTIAIELPGHGQTPMSTCSEPSMAGFAALVITLVKELELSQVVLVGHSMGCRVALSTWDQVTNSAGRDRNLPSIKGVVLMEGSHYKLKDMLYVFDTTADSMTPEERSAKGAELFFAMFSDATPKAFVESTKKHAFSRDPEYSTAVRQSFIGFDKERMDDLVVAFGRSECPMLNLQASNVDGTEMRQMKKGGTTRWTRFLSENVPQIQQEVIEESGHFPHVDHPDEVARHLMAFVEVVGLGRD